MRSTWITQPPSSLRSRTPWSARYRRVSTSNSGLPLQASRRRCRIASARSGSLNSATRDTASSISWFSNGPSSMCIDPGIVFKVETDFRTPGSVLRLRHVTRQNTCSRSSLRMTRTRTCRLGSSIHCRSSTRSKTRPSSATAATRSWRASTRRAGSGRRAGDAAGLVEEPGVPF